MERSAAGASCTEVEDTAQLSLPKWLEQDEEGEWGNLEPLCSR